MLSIYANSSLDLYKLLHGWQKCPGRHWGNQQLHHPNFIVRMGINPKVLDWSQKIWNVDSTENKEGMITHYLNLEVETKGILSCHGRDILLTWYKSTTRNMALRVWFWVLVLSRSCKEQLQSFWWQVEILLRQQVLWEIPLRGEEQGIVNWWTSTWILCTIRDKRSQVWGHIRRMSLLWHNIWTLLSFFLTLLLSYPPYDHHFEQ